MSTTSYHSRTSTNKQKRLTAPNTPATVDFETRLNGNESVKSTFSKAQDSFLLNRVTKVQSPTSVTSTEGSKIKRVKTKIVVENTEKDE